MVEPSGTMLKTIPVFQSEKSKHTFSYIKFLLISYALTMNSATFLFTWFNIKIFFL